MTRRSRFSFCLLATIASVGGGPVLASPYNPNAAYDPDAAYTPHSTDIEYELQAGTAIPAVMVSGINAGSTTRIQGQVTANVYDSATGQTLLIPKDSKLIGELSNSGGTSRQLVMWTQIILPDGLYLAISNMPGPPVQGALETYDQMTGSYVKVPTFSPLATIFLGGTPLTPQAISSSGSLAVPPGFLFNVMVAKAVDINPNGSSYPPNLIPLPPPAPATAPRPIVPVIAQNLLTPQSLDTDLSPAAIAKPKAVALPAPVATVNFVPATSPLMPLHLAPPPPPPEPVWTLEPGTFDGKDIVAWGQSVGWKVEWNLPGGLDWMYPGLIPATFRGDFTDAAKKVISELAAQAAGQGVVVRYHFYPPNQMLIINNEGQNDAP